MRRVSLSHTNYTRNPLEYRFDDGEHCSPQGQYVTHFSVIRDVNGYCLLISPNGRSN